MIDERRLAAVRGSVVELMLQWEDSDEPDIRVYADKILDIPEIRLALHILHETLPILASYDMSAPPPQT